MENSNCFSKSAYPQWPYPWPPFPFPFPDPFPPYLLSIMPNAGTFHNKLLDDIAIAFPNLDSSDEESWSFMTTETLRLTSQIGINGGKFISFKSAENHATNIKFNLNKYLKQLVKAGEISPFIADETNIILAIIKDFPETADVAFRLSAYTKQMAFRTDVSSEDKMILLGTASVGESTNYFWNQALKSEKNPYHKIAIGLNNGGNLSKIKWADVIGFVVGAVAGGVSGGPGGAVTGGVALGGFATKVFSKE